MTSVGACTSCSGHQLGQIAKSAAVDPLLLRGALLNQGRRRAGSAAMGNQLLADVCQAGQAHVEHQGLARADQIRPVEIETAVLAVPGDKTHRLGMVAVGQRNTGIGGAAGGGGNARDDLERNAFGGQLLDLLTAATEDERIATLEAQTPACPLWPA